MPYVICDEGDCDRGAHWVLTVGESSRRVCVKHRNTALKDLKFLHPGEPIEVDGGLEAIEASAARERLAALRRGRR